jgi:lipopolysaccharide/colanic/teichoic acid biosynthesis glycosyltransferase
MRGRAYDPLKRGLDVVVAVAALVLLAPLWMAVAVMVLATMGRPVLFRQRRPGRGGQPFTLMKFRTMTTTSLGSMAGVATDGQRLTRLGRWLRAASLDELPTLLNVLRGDMSIVGPRPLLLEYLDLYTPEQARRHEVRPGITGLAQTRGRNLLTWEQKFEHDVSYVDRRSFALDLRIIAATARTVVRREGITAPAAPTAHVFTRATLEEVR